MVDGHQAILGGMNIADEYMLGGSGARVEVLGGERTAWRDTDVYVEGMIARALRRMVADRSRGEARRNAVAHALQAPATSGTPGAWRISMSDLQMIAMSTAVPTDEDPYT